MITFDCGTAQVGYYFLLMSLTTTESKFDMKISYVGSYKDVNADINYQLSKNFESTIYAAYFEVKGVDPADKDGLKVLVDTRKCQIGDCLPPPPPPTCFSANSTVFIKDQDQTRTKKIQDLVPGEMVMTFDEKSLKTTWEPVLAIPHRNSQEMRKFMKLTLEDTNSLEVTENHYVWVIKEEIPQKKIAGEVKFGDLMVVLNEKHTQILKVNRIEEIYGLPRNVITKSRNVIVNNVLGTSLTVNEPGKFISDIGALLCSVDVNLSQEIYDWAEGNGFTNLLAKMFS